MKIFIADGGRNKVVASGYGRMSKNVGEWLIKLGHGVVFIDDNKNGYKDADVCLFICPPYGATVPYKGKYNAIITMHEKTTLPPEKEDWPNILNRLDLVITPSQWNKVVFENLGVTTRIEVAALGAEPELFYPVKDKFRIISVFSGLGSGSSRENWEDTIRAYLRAFKKKEDVELVFKTWQWKKENWDNIFNKIRKEEEIHHAIVPKITIIDSEITNDELRDLYQKSTVAIKNANRESWGLGANEAILCGLQMVSSNIPPLPVFMPRDTRWIELGDIGGLSLIMREEYMKFKNKMDERRTFTWENTAKRVGQILEAYAKTN